MNVIFFVIYGWLYNTLTLFYLGFMGLHILFDGAGGEGKKFPTFVFSKLEMVWQWTLAHIEAILCQVKIECEFSKWRILFDNVSTILHDTVKFTFDIYYRRYFCKEYLMAFSSKHNMEITKSEKLLKKKEKKISEIIFDIWRHPRKGVV